MDEKLRVNDCQRVGGLIGAHWRKSTRSGDNGGECIEVADNLTGVVAVRDSKDQTGPVLTFAPYTWSAFVAGVKAAGIVR